MELHRQRILGALRAQGWVLRDVDKDAVEPWAHEVWTIDSKGSSSRCSLFVTFFSNPAQKKKTDEWREIEAVMASVEPATKRLEFGSNPVLQNSTGQMFEAALVRFVMEVGSLRDTQGS